MQKYNNESSVKLLLADTLDNESDMKQKKPMCNQ